jgi:anti-anti-sigma factor
MPADPSPNTGARLTIEQHAGSGGAVRLALAGEIDLSTVHVVTAALAAVPPTTTAIAVDLANVVFIDSLGIGTLVAAWRTATNARQGFIVVNPHDIVKRVLDMTGVFSILSGGQPSEAAVS